MNNKSDTYSNDNNVPVSPNKMEQFELIIEKTDDCDFEALCELLSTKPNNNNNNNKCTQQISTWESEIFGNNTSEIFGNNTSEIFDNNTSEIFNNNTSEIVPDNKFELDYGFEYQNNNWPLDDKTKLADEEELICKAVIEQMDKCIKTWTNK